VSCAFKIVPVLALGVAFSSVAAHARSDLDTLNAQHDLTPNAGDPATQASKDAGVSEAVLMQPADTAKASVPVTVYGFLPGYTNTGLKQLVGACVAEAPVPGTLADAPRTGWQVQVDLENVSMPRVGTVVKATLLDGKKVVTSTWNRTAALDTVPRAVLCSTVSQLTQKLWASAAEHGAA
jgi:hypothetical protein